MDRQAESTPKNRISSFEAWAAAAVLFVCVMLTVSVIATAMELFSSTQKPDCVISLLPPDEKAQSAGGAPATLSLKSSAPIAQISPRLFTSLDFLDNTSDNFYITDNKEVWGSKTGVDIFRAAYENGSGVITAAGKNGDKIVAPGTSNTYTFNLTNDGDAAISYGVSFTATLSQSLENVGVPVRVRLSDDSGRWLCGSADTWESFTALDGVEALGTVGKTCHTLYTLEWEWPYESGDDAFDTMLGDLAENEELVLTVGIDVNAKYDPDPDKPGGIPQTGDNSNLVMWIFIMIMSAAGLVATVSLSRQAKRKNNGQ